MLTHQQIKVAPPREKAYKIYDERGLHLVVYPTGRKVWRLQYRVGGKQQQPTLGRWPDMSLAAARERAQAMREQLAMGVDPKTPKEAPQRLFRDVAEAYWQERVDISEGLRKNALSGLRQHLFPYVGEMPIDRIAREDLLEPLLAMDRKGLLVYLRKVRNWAGQVFEQAEERGWCKGNPAAEIRPSKAFRRARPQPFPALAPHDLEEFFLRLQLEKDIQSVRACRILALTWLRTKELRLLEWGDVNRERILIPGERMKGGRDHLVPLSALALELLEEQHRFTGRHRYVFINDGRPGKPMSENCILYLIHRIGYKGRMTGHGFRSSASTWANEAGFNPDAIEMQLAHLPVDKTRAAYNRSKYWPQRVEIMKAWAAWLEDRRIRCRPTACETISSSAQ